MIPWAVVEIIYSLSYSQTTPPPPSHSQMTALEIFKNGHNGRVRNLTASIGGMVVNHYRGVDLQIKIFEVYTLETNVKVGTLETNCFPFSLATETILAKLSWLNMSQLAIFHRSKILVRLSALNLFPTVIPCTYCLKENITVLSAKDIFSFFFTFHSKI